MESNGFMIGPDIKEIWAIKVVTSTVEHPVGMNVHVDSLAHCELWHVHMWIMARNDH